MTESGPLWVCADAIGGPAARAGRVHGPHAVTVATRRALILVALGVVIAPRAARAQEVDEVSHTALEVTKLSETLYVLSPVGEFGGSNVTVSAGPDGMFLVDTPLTPMIPKVKAALRAISSEPVRFLVNTHPHSDHHGGNIEFGRAGAMIIAHPRTRIDLAKGKPPTFALPSLTVDCKFAMHLNGEDIEVVHPLTGHTSSDLFVFFRKAKVVSLGDEYLPGVFPMIDDTGDLAGLTKNLEKLVTELTPDYRIVPGHGKVVTIADLRATLQMLRETTAIVRAGIADGKSLEQMKKARVLARYEAWGRGDVSQDDFLQTLHTMLRGKRR